MRSHFKLLPLCHTEFGSASWVQLYALSMHKETEVWISKVAGTWQSVLFWIPVACGDRWQYMWTETNKSQPYCCQYFFLDYKASRIRCLVFLIGVIPFWYLWIMLFISISTRNHQTICKLLHLHMLEPHKFMLFLLCYALNPSSVFVCLFVLLTDWLVLFSAWRNNVMQDWLRQMRAHTEACGWVLETPLGDGQDFVRQPLCEP